MKLLQKSVNTLSIWNRFVELQAKEGISIKVITVRDLGDMYKLTIYYTIIDDDTIFGD